MNSSIPDIASLQISQSNQQRINDSYDYDGDGDGNIRPHYHFSTSPAIPAQSALSQFNLTQTPLKNKTPARGGLPSVRIRFFSMFHSAYHLVAICHISAMVGRPDIIVRVQVAFSSTSVWSLLRGRLSANGSSFVSNASRCSRTVSWRWDYSYCHCNQEHPFQCKTGNSTGYHRMYSHIIRPPSRDFNDIYVRRLWIFLSLTRSIIISTLRVNFGD